MNLLLFICYCFLILFGIIGISVLYLFVQHNSAKPVPTIIINEDCTGYRLSITTESNIEICFLMVREDRKNTQKINPSDTKRINVHSKLYNRYFFTISHQRSQTKQQKMKYWFVTKENKKIGSKYFYLKFPLLNPSKPLRIALFGDIQMQEPLGVLESYMMFLVRKIGKPDFILCMGDIVDKFNNLSAWRYFFRMMRKILPNTPFYTTIGNHCGGLDLGITALNFIQTPSGSFHYSFRIRDILFITINSLLYESDKGEEQLEWLKNQLKNKEPSIKSTIFWTHMPPFGPPYNYKEYTRLELLIQEKLNSLFKEYPVDLQFYGHKHCYSREGNNIITASIHGVRSYPQIWTAEKKLKNRHHFCILEISEQHLMVRAITWWGSEMDKHRLIIP
jgi:hypothetical protein